MQIAYRAVTRCVAPALVALTLFSALPVRAQQASEPAAVELQPAEAAFEKQIQDAYGLLGVEGGFDEGYTQLRAALAELAKTDLFAFTVLKYTEAGTAFANNQLGEEAEAVFSEGEQTRAMNEDVKERADFYLAYGQFKVIANDFNRVVPLLTTATNLFAQYYGTESRQVIAATDVLARAVSSMGQYGTAVNLHQGNYDLGLKTLGPDDRLVWLLANNLADALRSIGAPSRALEYDLGLLEKRTAHYGRDHFNVLVTANNIAQNYLDLRDYPNALRYLELNRQIAVALRAQDPILEPQAETWIVYTHLLTGEQAFDDKTVAAMDALIEDQAYPALLSYRIAHLLAEHFAKTDPARSMKLLEQTLTIAVDNMSQFHPWAYESRRAIANAKAVTDPAGAAADYAKLDREMLESIAMQLRVLSNRDVSEATRAMADDMLYDYALLAEKSEAAVAPFADAARRWPSLQDADRDQLYKVMRLVDPADDETQRMLRQILRVSQATQEVFGAGADEKLGHELLDQMRPLEDKLNEHIAARYPAIDKAALEKPLPQASELLDGKEALVAYFTTRKWRGDRQSAKPFDDVRLYAIVWRKDEKPKLHYLGDPREITTLRPTLQVAALPESQPVARGAVPIGQVEEVFGDLYSRLVAPLETELVGADTLFVIPDGQLFAVPFSLLTDDTGRALEERLSIRVLTRPEALYGIRAEQKLPVGGRAILAGGLDYTNGAETGADPLPGTLKEVDTIATLLRAKAFAPELLTGAAATEAALRVDMENAAIAHLATHGSYGSPKNGGASNVDTLWQSDVILSKSGDRRTMARDETDGRLYASELMLWDLSKLDLLVLSACDTGRGDETFVGGLRGLPTAINISGARRSLLTLWPVADEGTANFMARFYEHLVEGMTYADALRQTRRDAVAGQVAGAQSPLVWAAFVMFEN